MAKNLFSEKMPCIFHYNAKKIRDTISRLVRDLAQKAKYAHMGIWTYGDTQKEYGQVGYPRKEHQKCSSGMLTSGP